MVLADLALVVLMVGVVLYAVLGGADFGAGFWDLTAGGAERGARLRGMVKFAMGPVWEANHVWLIFILVVFWTAFPAAFGPVMEALYVPLFLAAVGIIFRGAAFAVRGEAATIGEARLMGATFALASVLTPFFLGTVIGAVAAGQVPLEGEAGPFEAWSGPVPLYIGLLAVVSGAYMSAVFLAGDAVRAGAADMVAAFRRRALGAAIAAGVLALAGLPLVAAQAPELHDGLTSGAGLVMVAASALAGIVTIGLVWSNRFERARFTSAAAVGAIVAGWALAQRPDFLPGELPFADAAANDATLVALLAAVAVALIILIPALTLLYRLVLSGRLDSEFRPITAGDPSEGS